MKTLLLWTILCLLPLFAEGSPGPAPTFHSAAGQEREVSFRADFRTDFRALSELPQGPDAQRLFERKAIEPTIKFLFGPLTNRSLGSPQLGATAVARWKEARVENNRVILPYDYQAVWLVSELLPDHLKLPVPFNKQDLVTRGWKRCTDSAPEHQTDWFYWYFWDPERAGCDHREGVHFQIVDVALGLETTNQQETYPEYNHMIRDQGGSPHLQLTFGFGYVEDPSLPDPERDWDAGMVEYRAFRDEVRRLQGFRESNILDNEYGGSARRVIGRRFEGRLSGVNVVIKVVAAAGVDQMNIFARSFAQDHDGFFGWFGHSRVGSGFDAEQFWKLVVRAPSLYSVVEDYQLVYWGGCNSYSYYTLPFFDFKTHVANGADPFGTKGLDIIANGLPSYFSFNADNASIVLKHLLNWNQRPSYQKIVKELEDRASAGGATVLVSVLGDEDNDRQP